MSAQRSKYMPDHLSDGQAVQELKQYAAGERVSTAHLLGRIAVVDDRQLYRPAGFSSMIGYCVGELHLSEGAAYKRVTAARVAREFPILFDALADGRLHLSGIAVMSKHFTPGNVLDLVTAATHKTRAQIEILIAERFPQKETPTVIRVVPQRVVVAASHESTYTTVKVPSGELSPGTVQNETPSHSQVAWVQAAAPAPRVKPIAPQRFSLQLTMDQSTHDKLRRAQELLSHAIPNGDVAQVLDRALDALISKLEKRKLGKTDKPRTPKASSNSKSRNIPADVVRAVQERDQGQCTFVSDSGHRCGERRFLEYDHVEPFARGGEATIENIRLRCRTHNQYEAEQTYGAGFMHEKRERARRTASG